MRGHSPLQPEGSSPEFLFAKNSWRKLFGLERQLNDSTTVKWSKTPRGIQAHVKIPPAVSAPGTAVAQYQILDMSQMHGDYFLAYKFPLVAGDNFPVAIAKPNELMNSVIKETLDGVEYDYAYDPSFVKRTSTNASTGDVENQVIVPRYRKYSVIWAATVDQIQSCDFNGQGTLIPGVKFVDINAGGRAWAASSD